MSKLDSKHAAALTKHGSAAMAGGGRASASPKGIQKLCFSDKLKPQAKAKVVVTVDVEELLCPIELEVCIHLLERGCDFFLHAGRRR